MLKTQAHKKSRKDRSENEAELQETGGNHKLIRERHTWSGYFRHVMRRNKSENCEFGKLERKRCRGKSKDLVFVPVPG